MNYLVDYDDGSDWRSPKHKYREPEEKEFEPELEFDEDKPLITNMGLNTRIPKTYININQGMVTLKCKADTPGAIARTNKNGDVVHELVYTDLTGYLTDLTIREGDYGKEWVLTIADETTTFQLSLQYSGGNSMGLMCALPNVDFEKLITFVPWYKEVLGDDKKIKKKSALYLHQKDFRDGQDKTVPWAFSKDEPNGCPPLVKVVFKGEDRWDDTDRMTFFEAMVRDDISLRIKNANLRRAAGIFDQAHEEEEIVPVVMPQAPISEVPTNEPLDDLPF